jgi:hypothetical protein
MKHAIARLLIGILTLYVWLGLLYDIAMPVISVLKATDAPKPFITYSMTFSVLLLIWYVSWYALKIVVHALQYIFLRSSGWPRLFVAAKIDTPEVMGAITAGKYTEKELFKAAEENEKFHRSKLVIGLGFALNAFLYLAGAIYLWFTIN